MKISFPSTICKEGSFSIMYVFDLSVKKIRWLWLCDLISRSSSLFHESTHPPTPMAAAAHVLWLCDIVCYQVFWLASLFLPNSALGIWNPCASIWIFFFCWCEEWHWYFDEDFIEPTDCFSGKTIFTILILPILEWGRSFHLHHPLKCLKVFITEVSHTWLGSSIGIFFF